MSKIPASAINFIKALSNNNNRDWFNANKPQYVEEHQHLIAFADALLAKMREHDNIDTPTGKKSLHRIYRDVRFSKNKLPYKNNWSGGFRRATKLLRGGYYYHIEPGNTFAAGGFWGPNSDDLKLIRTDIAANDEELRSIITAPAFQQLFGELLGVGVKTAPKGFSKEHPAIDLLRKKQFIVKRHFTDKEVLQADFVDKVNETFKGMRPFFNYMSEVLTTDTNGVPLY